MSALETNISKGNIENNVGAGADMKERTTLGWASLARAICRARGTNREAYHVGFSPFEWKLFVLPSRLSMYTRGSKWSVSNLKLEGAILACRRPAVQIASNAAHDVTVPDRESG